MHQSSTSALLLRLHFVVFIWGFTAILGDLISLSALPLVWNRMGIASAILLAVVFLRKKSMRISPKGIGLMALAGSLIAAHWVAFFHAIKISNVSVTLVCLSSTAFFTAFLEPLFYRRKIRLFEVLLGIITILAIGFIFSLRIDYLWGMITAILAAILASLFSILNGKLAQKYDSNIISTYEILAGFLVISAFILWQSPAANELLPASQNDWIFILILGAVCTAFPYLESVKVMQKLTPFTVVLTINLEPVYGILLAYFMLGEEEKMSPQFYFGAALIISTLFANAWLRKRERKKSMVQHQNE